MLLRAREATNTYNNINCKQEKSIWVSLILIFHIWELIAVNRMIKLRNRAVEVVTKRTKPQNIQ